MIIFPAIDIVDGNPVRLSQGDFSSTEQVAESAIETAMSFKEAGAKWIHMVDLDGARTGGQPNKGLFLEIAKKTGLKIQLGGGIRDLQTATQYLENGIERVIIGSAAVKNPRFVADLLHEYHDRVAVGIDARKGVVQTDGWQNESKANYITMAKLMQEIGAQYLIYTDIAHDGMLDGPNLADLLKLKNSVKSKLIASGGIKDKNDIKELKKLNVYGAICGKSLYKGTLSLKEAIEIAGEQEEPENVEKEDNSLS